MNNMVQENALGGGGLTAEQKFDMLISGAGQAKVNNEEVKAPKV